VCTFFSRPTRQRDRLGRASQKCPILVCGSRLVNLWVNSYWHEIVTTVQALSVNRPACCLFLLATSRFTVRTLVEVNVMAGICQHIEWCEMWMTSYLHLAHVVPYGGISMPLQRVSDVIASSCAG